MFSKLQKVASLRYNRRTTG